MIHRLPQSIIDFCILLGKVWKKQFLLSTILGTVGGLAFSNQKP